jgi:hypothetical protein
MDQLAKNQSAMRNLAMTSIGNWQSAIGNHLGLAFLFLLIYYGFPL